jgi:hypothetical protein
MFDLIVSSRVVKDGITSFISGCSGTGRMDIFRISILDSILKIQQYIKLLRQHASEKDGR